jgi:hypothetical protein
MDRFNASGTCTKCGSQTPAGYEYHAKGRRQRSPIVGITTPRPARLLCPTDEEHMHRKCPDCKHEWAEAPLA